jgi:glutathione S-transferase
MLAFYMPADNPGKEIMKKMVVEEKLPKIFGYFERHLAKYGTSFCAGDKISIADIRLYCILYTIKSGIHAGLPTNLADKYPHISKLYQAIDTHEKVASWNKSQAK